MKNPDWIELKDEYIKGEEKIFEVMLQKYLYPISIWGEKSKK
jgi:hypothetical protein